MAGRARLVFFFTNQNPMSNVPCAVERGPIFILKIQNMYVAFPEGVTLYGNTPHSPASRPWRID